MNADVRALARATAELASENPERGPALVVAVADRLRQHGTRRDLAAFPKLLRRMLRRYGPLEAEIEVLKPLTETERAGLETALRTISDRPVALTVSEHPSLIGGARLRVGDERLDASLRGALHRLSSLLS
ncbi:MAG TPA: F0F1 ATP synthase subunit delta [Candidatus Peribacteraceae bacterium]|nr:F0F1 ATP synthase subunit delta [Candidatus Peribacteraceae bacterium]